MSGVAADLATLREALTRWPTASDEVNLAALDRVEAELARLTQELDAQKQGHYDALKKWERQVERAEAAVRALAASAPQETQP